MEINQILGKKTKTRKVKQTRGGNAWKSNQDHLRYKHQLVRSSVLSVWGLFLRRRLFLLVSFLWFVMFSHHSKSWLVGNSELSGGFLFSVLTPLAPSAIVLMLLKPEKMRRDCQERQQTKKKKGKGEKFSNRNIEGKESILLVLFPLF